jgi:hypothetical protein
LCGRASTFIDGWARFAVTTSLVHDDRQDRSIAEQLMPCASGQHVLFNSVHGNSVPAMAADTGSA